VYTIEVEKTGKLAEEKPLGTVVPRKRLEKDKISVKACIRLVFLCRVRIAFPAGSFSGRNRNGVGSLPGFAAIYYKSLLFRR
jgi:hypothetical protein